MPTSRPRSPALPLVACLSLALLQALATPAFAQSDADRATARSLGVEGQMALESRDYKAAERRVFELLGAKKLDEATVVEFAGNGKYEELVASLAALCAVPVSVVDRLMAGGRVDEVPDNVFHVSSRINSTWGGGLTDMVRSRRILEIIEADGLFDHAAKTGNYFLNELQGVGDRHAAIASNVRGRGLMCAIDLPDPSLRDRAITLLREAQVLVLPCGERTVRFRPALNVTTDELKVGLRALDDVLGRLAAAAATDEMRS